MTTIKIYYLNQWKEHRMNTKTFENKKDALATKYFIENNYTNIEKIEID